MKNDTSNDDQSIYEIGYLVASSVPEDRLGTETEALKDIVISAGANIIAEEAPHRQVLSYTVRKKTVSGAYEKNDVAYFGWIKFEIGSDKVEELKKAFEKHPAVLRVLLISTVRENTFLGKRASDIASQIANGKPVFSEYTATDPNKSVVPVSVEDMDKSIDELVKEA